jgi:ribosomal protein S21
MSASNRKGCNFSVKLHPKANKQSTEVNNARLVKKFIKKFKESGIVRELRNRQYPITRGQKARMKKQAGKRRAAKARQKQKNNL